MTRLDTGTDDLVATVTDGVAVLTMSRPERRNALTAAMLESEAFELARRLAAGPRVALRYMKENLNRAVLGDLSESLDLEAVHHLRTFETADHREAARAFVEKRRPSFVGH